MFLRLCFGIVACASIWFTMCYFAQNKHNDKIFITIILFEIIVFIIVEHHIWILD